ncbi:MAG: hypothetical protein ACI4VK_03570 [Candidatus Coproplasma sp.]
MSLKKIQQVKNSKWFRVWDLLVYGIILVAVVALIIAVTVNKDTSPLEGVSLSYRGITIYTYEFEKDKSEITLGREGNVSVGEKDADGSFTVLFTTDDGEGYNSVFINVKERSVKVTASNCSAHKDCVYTAKITNNGSLPIICPIHSLTVSPLKYIDSGIIIT